MSNDFLSLRRRTERVSPRLARPLSALRRLPRLGVALGGLLLSLSCGGEEDTTTTYNDDIRPLFNRRCTTCHRQGGPSGIDIQNPFSPATGLAAGLVGSRNIWKDANPQLPIPELNVAPGDPDNSFLMDKISPNQLPPDPDGNGPGVPPAGTLMPLQIPPLSEAQVGLLRDWIAAGAPRGAFMDRQNPPQARDFDLDIRRRIFGDEEELRQTRGVCDLANDNCPRCIYCHYAGTPNPPNLSDPFAPDGLVNVPAIYRANTVRVVPGDPDASFLIAKVVAVRPDSDVGAQMPYSYNALTQSQIDLVRQWIVEGALP